MENLSSHAGFVRAWVRVALNDGAICSALRLLSEGEKFHQVRVTVRVIVKARAVARVRIWFLGDCPKLYTSFERSPVRFQC